MAAPDYDALDAQGEALLADAAALSTDSTAAEVAAFVADVNAYVELANAVVLQQAPALAGKAAAILSTFKRLELKLAATASFATGTAQDVLEELQAELADAQALAHYLSVVAWTATTHGAYEGLPDSGSFTNLAGEAVDADDGDTLFDTTTHRMARYDSATDAWTRFGSTLSLDVDAVTAALEAAADAAEAAAVRAESAQAVVTSFEGALGGAGLPAVGRAAARTARVEPASWTAMVPAEYAPSTSGVTAVRRILTPIGAAAATVPTGGIAALRFKFQGTADDAADVMTWIRGRVWLDPGTHDPADFVLLAEGYRTVDHCSRVGRHAVVLDRRVTSTGLLYAELESDGPFKAAATGGDAPFDNQTYGRAFYATTPGGPLLPQAGRNVYVDVGDLTFTDDGPTDAPPVPTADAAAQAEYFGEGPSAAELQAALDALGLEPGEEEQATAGLNDPFWFDFGADVYAYHQRVLLEDADGEALDVFNGVEFGLSPRDEGTAITRAAYRIQLAGPDEDRPDVDGPVLVHRRVGVHIPYGQDAVRVFRFKRVDVSAYRVEGEKLYAWVTVCADAPLRGYGRGVGSSEVRIRDPHTDPAGTDVVEHERPDLAVWESAVSGVAAHIRLVRFGAPTFAEGGGGSAQIPMITDGRSMGRIWTKAWHLLEGGLSGGEGQVPYVCVRMRGNSLVAKGVGPMLSRLAEVFPTLTPVPGYVSSVMGVSGAKGVPSLGGADLLSVTTTAPPAQVEDREDFLSLYAGQPYGADLYRLRLHAGDTMTYSDVTYRRFILSYLKGPGLGVLTVSVNGGAATTLDCDAEEVGRGYFWVDDLDPEVENEVVVTCTEGSNAATGPRILDVWVDNGGTTGELSVGFCNQGSSGVDHWYALIGQLDAFWKGAYEIPEEDGGPLVIPQPDVDVWYVGNYGGDLGDEEEAVITSEKVRALLEASISESVAVFSLHEAAYPWVDGALDTADLTHAHQPGVVFGIPHDRARSTTIPAGMTRAENDIRRRVHFLAAESVSNGFVDIHHHGAYILTWPEDQFGPGAGEDRWLSDGTHPKQLTHDIHTKKMIRHLFCHDLDLFAAKVANGGSDGWDAFS